MRDKPKFIRKNGKIIPIREKGDSESKFDKKAKNASKRADSKDRKATKEVVKNTVGGGLASAGLAMASGAKGKTIRKFGAIGATAGLLVGSISARMKGYSSGKDREKSDDAHERASWERKKKAYAKMDKKKANS